MSYEPTLVINYRQLNESLPVFEKEQYDKNDDISRVAKYLLYDVATRDVCRFPDLELVICRPEFTTFNRLVREKLHDLDIDFRISN